MKYGAPYPIPASAGVQRRRCHCRRRPRGKRRWSDGKRHGSGRHAAHGMHCGSAQSVGVHVRVSLPVCLCVFLCVCACCAPLQKAIRSVRVHASVGECECGCVLKNHLSLLHLPKHPTPSFLANAFLSVPIRPISLLLHNANTHTHTHTPARRPFGSEPSSVPQVSPPLPRIHTA